MGVVNVTPDSFSDGGRYLDPDAAIRHGLALIAEGADVLDVGGESTRPGAEPVTEADERARVLPVVAALAADSSVPVSIDTTKAAVAAAAIAAGASVVNDVSAGLADPRMLAVVAEAGAGFVAMHMQGEPRTMQHDPHYDDVVTEVADFLIARLHAARAAGIAPVASAPIPASGSARRRATILLCSRGCPSSSIASTSRFSSAPRARRSSARCSVTRHRTRATTAPSPPSCGRSTAAP